MSKNDQNKISIVEFDETLIRVQIMLRVYEVFQSCEQPPDGIIDFQDFNLSQQNSKVDFRNLDQNLSEVRL